MRAVVPHAVEVIFMIAAGLMGLLLLAYGALGLCPAVQARPMSQRLLFVPVYLLTIDMGSFLMLVSVDREDLARMLLRPDRESFDPAASARPQCALWLKR